MAKSIAILLGVLLLATNGAWLYAAIDLAVTEKYRQLEEHNRKEQINALIGLANHYVAGRPKKEVKKLVVELYPESEPFEKEGYLNILWLSFKINNVGNIEYVVTSP